MRVRRHLMNCRLRQFGLESCLGNSDSNTPFMRRIASAGRTDGFAEAITCERRTRSLMPLCRNVSVSASGLLTMKRTRPITLIFMFQLGLSLEVERLGYGSKILVCVRSVRCHGVESSLLTDCSFVIHN